MTDFEAKKTAGERCGSGPAKTPERTCLGCRAKKAQTELDRVALKREPDGLKAVWDSARRLGGRGAWLCRGGQSCLKTAVKKNAFNRAFRVGGNIDATSLFATREATETNCGPPVEHKSGSIFSRNDGG